MNDLVVKSSRKKMAVATIGSMGFVLVGIVILRIASTNGEALIGILTALVFGTFALIGLFVLLRNPPRLILSDTGLIIRGNGIGKIAWTDISSVEVKSADRHPKIVLSISPKKKYLKRRARSRNPLLELDGDLERGYVTIELETLDIEKEVLADALKKRAIGIIESSELLATR